MWRKLIDILFPVYCSQTHRHGTYLDRSLQRQLTPHPPICPVCKKFSKDFWTHPWCAKESALDGCVIGFVYDKQLTPLLFKLKYGHRKHIATYLAQKLSLHIQAHPFLSRMLSLSNKNHIFLSDIPSHRYKKYFKRGYNQSTELCLHLSQFLSILFTPFTKKIKRTTSQVRLKKSARFDNVHSSFGVRSSSLHYLADAKIVLLVDDIMTTGASLQEVAKTIKSVAPEVRVRGVVVARKH